MLSPLTKDLLLTGLKQEESVKLQRIFSLDKENKFMYAKHMKRTNLVLDTKILNETLLLSQKKPTRMPS